MERGLDPNGLFFSLCGRQTDSRRAQMSSIHHSYLVAAAPQAHPSPFPIPCRRVSSIGSALINLITNRRMDPRPGYLSAKLSRPWPRHPPPHTHTEPDSKGFTEGAQKIRSESQIWAGFATPATWEVQINIQSLSFLFKLKTFLCNCSNYFMHTHHF